MNSNRYDVIVVGTGPAGSSLSFLLAQAGLEVLAIDRVAFPRQKTCGGAVTWRTRKLVESLTGDPFNERFHAKGDAVRFEIFEKGRLMVSQPSPEPFYFIDRSQYDISWVELAGSAGCRFRMDDPVSYVDPITGAVRCRSGEKLEARVVVGADGVNSMVRRCLFPGSRFRHNLALAFQASIPRDLLRPAYRSPAPKIFLGDIRCGYGWIFPGGQDCLIGLCGLVRKNPRPAESYRRFLEKVLTGDNRAAPDIHPVPSGNFLLNPGRDKALLVGDAAGFADPLTGEGLYFAHRSALLAARAVQSGLSDGMEISPLPLYRASLTPLYRDLRAGLRLRNLAYAGARYLGYPVAGNAWFYARLAEGIHGIRRFSSLPFLSH